VASSYLSICGELTARKVAPGRDGAVPSWLRSQILPTRRSDGHRPDLSPTVSVVQRLKWNFERAPELTPTRASAARFLDTVRQELLRSVQDLRRYSRALDAVTAVPESRQQTIEAANLCL
jgi:hypothetical protein